MKKNILITLIFCCLAASCQNQNILKKDTAKPTGKYNQKILVGNKELFVQIVTSQAEMQQGLSNRENLNTYQGMLFNFGSPQAPEFWMKDMKFNLDLIWIANKKIVGITENVPAPTTEENLDYSKLPLYSPPQKVDMVLEVNANWCKKNNIKVNDLVKIKLQGEN